MNKRKVTCRSCGASRMVVDGGELRRIRERAGVSLRELATRIGFTASYLCDVELNRRNATDAIVVAYRREVTK